MKAIGYYEIGLLRARLKRLRDETDAVLAELNADPPRISVAASQARTLANTANEVTVAAARVTMLLEIEGK